MKEVKVYRFICANKGCQVAGSFDPTGTLNQKKNNWGILSRIIEIDNVKYREIFCKKCGCIFLRLHEDTPEEITRKMPELRMRCEIVYRNEEVKSNKGEEDGKSRTGEVGIEGGKPESTGNDTATTAKRGRPRKDADSN